MNYQVNGESFELFTQATRHAAKIGAENVFGVRECRNVWTAAPKKAASKVRHVLLNADGTTSEFSRVRR